MHVAGLAVAVWQGKLPCSGRLIDIVLRLSPEPVRSRPKHLRIALEGNIAAGKSTLLGLLEDQLDYIAVPEPLSKWQEVGDNGTAHNGGNLLELFYKDPKRWGTRDPNPTR